MAQSRALTTQGEAIEDSERIVTSALTTQVWASLPEVAAGASDTVAVDFDITVFANNEGPIELVDFNGNRVVWVRPFTQVTVRSRANTRSPWEILGAGQQKGLTIADLAVTAPATAASASSFTASFVAATLASDINTAVDANLAVLETAVALSFAEIQAKVNHAIAAMAAVRLIQLADQTEGTGTLALADVSTDQLVDDDERTVTSARARDTFAILPEIVAGGTGAAVPVSHTVRFTSTAAGDIIIRDFRHRWVTRCPAYQSITVAAMDVVSNTWRDLGTSSETNAKTPAPKVAPLSVVMPVAAASNATFTGGFTAAKLDTAIDLGIDTAFTLLDTNTATAFALVETILNSLLDQLDTLDVTTA